LLFLSAAALVAAAHMGQVVFLAALAAGQDTQLARLVAREHLVKDTQGAAHLAQQMALYTAALVAAEQALLAQMALHLLRVRADMGYLQASLALPNLLRAVVAQVVKALGLVALAAMVAGMVFSHHLVASLAVRAKPILAAVAAEQVGHLHLEQTAATAALV
jgi:hypothetical protein